MSQSVFCWADPLVSGIYHTSICVEFKNGIKYEFSFNSRGLATTPAKNRKPKRSHYLGKTDKTLTEAIQRAFYLLNTKYCKYDALGTNCNQFSNDLSLWLCEELIPAEYIFQSSKVKDNPFLLACYNIGKSVIGSSSR